ncbi:MAG: carbamate kinase, partial [Candidatus Thorarchaeota archaeon]
MAIPRVKTAVVAIGGNSLIKDKEHRSVPDQYSATAETCKHIADMIVQGWNVVITSGNGPQVGFILRRSELASHELHEVPLDYCGADTQGAIGYMIQKALYNEFANRNIDKDVASLVT